MRNAVRVTVRWLVVVFTMLAAPGVAAVAQAPRITDQGDPSVANDTIYQLAVDSTAYPEQATVLLFDDGVIRIESDGRGTRTFRQVVQILRQRAVPEYQERQFSYDPDHQRVTVNWIRVLKRTGEVISAQPSHIQESDVPAAMANPVYVHRKMLRLSLTGVAPGTLVDMSWTVDERGPYRAGDFFQSWRVTAGTTVRRSRFLVDVPKDMKLRITERNLDFPRRQLTTGNRTVMIWWTKDVPWIRPEMFAPPPDSNDTGMWIAVAAPGSWADIGRWYAGLSHDRLRVDSVLRDTVRAVVGHAASLDDSIRAIHRWVAQDVRYVSVSLGIGGYQPRPPDTVLSTGFGDCKDKATLFVAALGVIGVEAYPVLLDAGGRPDRALPTIGAFNHEIAAIKRPTGYQFVDLTLEFSRFGTLPYPDEGQFALVVHPNGHTDEVTIPPDPPGANESTTRFVGMLDTTGEISGRVTWQGHGVAELGMRAAMSIRMDSAQRAAFLRRAASTLFPNAKGDSLATFDGRDLGADARVTMLIRDGQATQQSGETDILTLHEDAGQWNRLADELEARGPRHMPIDASAVIGPSASVNEVRITLPAGWRARLPQSVAATSAFGQFEASYRQDGRDLVIVHRLSGAQGILPKERIGDLVTWFRAMGKDRVSFIVLDHTPDAAVKS